MSRWIKKLSVLALGPVLWAGRPLSPIRRLASFARCFHALQGRVDLSTVVLGCPEIHGTADIRIGADGYLYRELYLETREDGHIDIGDAVVISRGTHLVAYSAISIGNGVMIGEYVSIRDANHRRVSGHSVRHTGHVSAPIRIDDNVWIGRGAVVLPGVTIGAGAVIGANAVVTKDVPPDAVYAGIPARDLSGN